MSFKNNQDLQFQFRLARDLGMTVQDLRTKMSSYEYTQWATFYIHEHQEESKAIAIAEAEALKRRN